MEITIGKETFKDVKHMLGGIITEAHEELQFGLIASPDLPFNEAMQIIQSITMHLLTTFATQKPEALGDIYDAYNFMATSVLQNLIPDKDIRPDVTEEAIMAKEMEIIQSKYDNLTDEQKEEALRKIDELKQALHGSKSSKSDEA